MTYFSFTSIIDCIKYVYIHVCEFIISDLLGENAGGPGAALGFQYFGGPVVTVLASKTSR